MDLEASLAHVRNSEVEFLTLRPPGSPFATLDRRVVVTGPAELVELARTGDRRALAGLVALLRDPDRAWAAAVMLAAMTGREAKIVDSFAARPQEWWAAVGATAHERWTTWLQQAGEQLVWDATRQVFQPAPPGEPAQG
jgi:hypothetical protein